MPKSELGELELVDITEVWENEPRDFTPWLVENLARLSKAIGLPIVNAVREFKTDETGEDRYSADIVAETPDGLSVLIENQFGRSDHKHLGQIMTYVPGSKAKLIIWVAPGFRESHRSAIRWLNSNTHDDFSFFAVQLSAVRIGSSQIAPLFEVVERPNGWERRLSESIEAKTANPSEKRQFWDLYEKIFPYAADDMGGGGRGSTRWREVPDASLFVARWFAGDNVGVFVRGPRKEEPDAFWQLPAAKQNKIASELGVEVDEDDYLLIKWADIEINGKDDWEKAVRWLESETKKYCRVISKHMKA